MAAPLGASVCALLMCLLVISALAAHAFCSIGPRMEAVPKDEIELFGTVPLMFFPFLAPAALLSIFEQFMRPQTDHKAVAMCRLIILEFGSAIAYYYALYHYAGGIVHQNLRSQGPPRPEYLGRFAGWALGLPLTTTVVNLPVLDECTTAEAMKRLAPNCLASSAYCWVCYLGMVVQNPVMGWWLCILGCVTYLSSLIDQIELVITHSGHSQFSAVKVFPVLIKEIIYIAYMVVYMLSLSGAISSYTKESAFCFFDMAAKTVVAIFAFLFWAAFPALSEASMGGARAKQA